jgi:hypothetical protein
MSESFQALRQANPRSKPTFARSVDEAAEVVRAAITAGVPEPKIRRPRRLRLVPAAGVAVAAALGLAVFLSVSLPGGGPAVEDAVAAVEKAATVTAASAERSGTVVVRITHDGELWAGATIRWNGEDLALANTAPDRQGRTGLAFLLVDGMMYGIDEETGGWVELGPPESIDPDSGTTPGEMMTAVREDVGGETLRRIVRGMTGLTTAQLDDGSTIYSGQVAAGLVAREKGFKEGQHIRVLPFGNVAHGKAADPGALLDAAITVGADGVVRAIEVTWGTWAYSVTYSDLGATEAPEAPANAKPLRRR